jgi:phospholipid/cholesterol/gamma-HCH transport system substrate-binding protein
MEINKRYGPLPANSQFGVRLRTIVGENYVALYPGNSKKMLPDNSLLGPSQEVEDVDFDQILSTLQGGTRTQAQHMIEGLGGALADRGLELNSLLSGASGVVNSSAPVTQVLAEEHAEVSQLVNQLGQVSTAIGQRGQDIDTIAQDANTTFTAIASRDTSLAQTVERLPAALMQVRTTSDTLASVTGTAAPVLSKLATAVNLLNPAVRALRPAAEDGNALIQELGAAAPSLDTTLAHLRTISAPASSALPEVHKTLCQVTPAAKYLSPYAKEFSALLEDMGSATNFYDANAHAARLYFTVGQLSLNYFSPQASDAIGQLLNLGILGLSSHIGYDPLPKPGAAGETWSPSDPTSYLTDKIPYPRISAEC